VRNLSPPYISTEAEVVHRELCPNDTNFIVLCSDGLIDLCGGGGGERAVQDIANDWAHVLLRTAKTSASPISARQTNFAVELLRFALGGDAESVSAALSDGHLEVDDTSIIVSLL
jgi:pyruvate dehydrogenase phosphatase